MAEVFACQVEVLDGSTVCIDVNKRTIGEVLLTEVFKHLGLEETDYFGLQYLDAKEHVQWIDPLKIIKKQVNKGRFNFRFRVKLYPISVTFLFEEATRYFLALQLKEDLLNEKFFCSDDTLAVVNSLIVQGEAGDFDIVDHPDGYLDDFPSLEDKPLDFKNNVIELHKRNRGLLPAECDKRFLDIACRLDRYGMDFHTVLDISGIKLFIGVSAKGVTVFCGEKPFLTPLNNFPWVRIAGVNFKSKQIHFEMVTPASERYTEVIVFSCPTKQGCKTLWKSCVEHHTFFRTVKTESIKRPAATSLFRRGSTFRFSGRTQFKLLQEGTSTRRSSRRFERISSRNRSGRRTM